MVREGRFIAQFVAPVDAEQIQPNGVDLRLGQLFRVTGTGALHPDRTELAEREPVDLPDDPAAAPAALAPGAYVVRYVEKVYVPDGHVGLILPRSSLLRNGAVLYSALWDQGYEGRGEGLLVLWHPLVLPKGCRIGQFVLMTAEAAAAYRGQWQGENLGPGRG